ncbi:superoxide dismutase family protein [Bacillus sp. V33-4]|uniref:superoxide dismutase family protein n=1 Tax=Bacillus sp. V33-4 TaxID=2054169 RepID=UPI000C78CD0D|nr:superoxide dismutase family protein [Bacillus sp. V33-4]PLR81154.1 hypothetical protein CVD23_19550 [Bacillus sp. V33-4]
MIKCWIKPLLPMFAVQLLFGCGAGENSSDENSNKAETTEQEIVSAELKEPQAKAEVKDVNKKTVGTVSFSEHDEHILIKASMTGLKPGHHGFHIHEKGVCEPDAAEGPFTTAGGHFNPNNEMHSGHAGDMPSLYVNEDGTANYSAVFDRLTMEQITEQELAVMIHEKPDNFGNIPDRYQAAGQGGPDAETRKTGDAGKRQACGVIVSSGGEEE